MASVGGNSNQRIQNRISTAVNSPNRTEGNKQAQLTAARRNFHINDDRLSSFKVMKQLLEHMGGGDFRTSLNTFIDDPDDQKLSGLMRTVVGKYNGQLSINMDGANTSYDILHRVSNKLVSNERLTVPDGQNKTAFECLTCLYALLKIAGRDSQFKCVAKGELVDGNNKTIEHSSDTAATNWCKSTMQLISNTDKDQSLTLKEAYNLLTLKENSPPNKGAAAQGDATKDKVAMKLQQFINKDVNTINAPETLDASLKQQLFDAIESKDHSKFDDFLKEKDKTRLVTTTETTTVNNAEVLVTTAQPKEAAAPVVITSKEPRTIFSTADMAIQVDGIATIDTTSGTINPDDDGTTITATITQQRKSPIQCKKATVSLTGENEVTVTGGTVTQEISNTTINFNLNTTNDGGGGDGGGATPASVTINNGVITMTVVATKSVH